MKEKTAREWFELLSAKQPEVAGPWVQEYDWLWRRRDPGGEEVITVCYSEVGARLRAWKVNRGTLSIYIIPAGKTKNLNPAPYQKLADAWLRGNGWMLA